MDGLPIIVIVIISMLIYSNQFTAFWLNIKSLKAWNTNLYDKKLCILLYRNYCALGSVLLFLNMIFPMEKVEEHDLFC